MPPTTHAVSTTVEHDVQENVVAITAVCVGAPRVHKVNPNLEIRGALPEEGQRHYERFARGCVSGR